MFASEKGMDLMPTFLFLGKQRRVGHNLLGIHEFPIWSSSKPEALVS